VQRARALVHAADARTLDEQITLARIPAPTFAEAERGGYVRERFNALGLDAVATDEVGNVSAVLSGAEAKAAPLVLSAHLDTVFPAETDLTVRRRGAQIRIPGITDNARGLAAMLALADALVESGLRPSAPIAFVATVGEEGTGDLRGTKHLFREGSPLRETPAFISLDGSGLRRIVNRAVGSVRLRLVVRGPGGHSWADAGTANPIAAIAAAITRIEALERPDEPRTSAAVTRTGGGTSINAIPAEAWADVDLRSEGAAELERLEREARVALDEAVAAVNQARPAGTDPLTASVEPLGYRPAGTTPEDAPLVQAAIEATRAVHARPLLVASSTDANVPISLGIPAITLGAGGEGGGIHTTDEWFSNRGGVLGIERALLTALSIAGVD
jgi:acetylornithine deacetylase/succinyl-diaminopimelate desuccinylase-like protein